MPSHSTRLLSALLAVSAVLAAVVAPVAAAHPHGPSADDYTFIGGGWGHGTGMSQYGAWGRAEAGLTYQEILTFYYDGTTVRTDSSLVPDSVDVLIAVHNTTVFRPSGRLSVAMDGRFLDTTVNTLTVRRGTGGWHINSSNIDWCRGFCNGTVLTVSFNGGEPVRVSDTSNSTNRYARGRFRLTPAASNVSNCGNAGANQYCLVVGGLTMQQYLYGIDEVPHSWPAEALKAQAVAARSYAAAVMAERRGWSSPFDVYASTRDQQYKAWDFESQGGHDIWAAQVDATEDTVVTYQPDDGSAPRVAVAYYSASNGGYTAANEEPRRDSVSYLLAKPDPYDAAPDQTGTAQNPYNSWERTYTTAEISRWLADYPFADMDVGEIREILIEDPGPSGRIDDALVTLIGSDATLEVRDDNGDPYGYRFYYALVLGCRNTPDCKPLRSTKMALLDAHTGDSPSSSSVFADVADDAPYADAVYWMRDSEITRGTSATTFSPERPLTRGQFATLLWRFAGEPSASNSNSNGFEDVPSASHHADAVDWMVDLGITQGCSTEPKRFCLHMPLTASHLAAFLWRFAGRSYSNHAIPYTDIHVNAFYLEAARWLTEHRLWVTPDYRPPPAENAVFMPDEQVDRGRAALLIWNLASAPDAFDADVPLPPLMRDS
ncbi:MAG: S-layer homology domain-containing protein [Acidimicrobiaceae bacterium]|nr:S-layer homology domain-containing protein [Acidimicrobiaceae bacterium]